MHWLLPDGVEEWLPPDSWRLEELRRRVIDVFASHGFELILPPLLEYTESLHSGVGRGLERQTFSMIDQTNGRHLGVRADITPQAARIDASRYAEDSAEVRRLCYLGTVLRTHPDTLGGPRSLRQLGAEIFGHAGLDADVEAISVMCDVLAAADSHGFTLDLSHVGIVRALIPTEVLDQSESLLAALQRKAPGEVRDEAVALKLSAQRIASLVALCEMHGNPDVVRQHRESLPEVAREQFDELLTLSSQIEKRYPQIQQHLDVAELSGFYYETGVTWAAYLPGSGRSVARGGRYDGIGSVFGADRPATGFSANLNQLLQPQHPVEQAALIWAPAGDEPELLEEIARLRAAGRRVRTLLPGEEPGEGQKLQRVAQSWTLSQA